MVMARAAFEDCCVQNVALPASPIFVGEKSALSSCGLSNRDDR